MEESNNESPDCENEINLVSSKRHMEAKPPKEAYFYVPRGREVIEFDEKYPNKTLRRIFDGGVEYNYFEIHKLKQLKRDIEKHNTDKPKKVIFPDSWKESDTLRFLQASGYNSNKTIEFLINHFEWRSKNLPAKFCEKTKDILNSGFIYIHGRDSRYRPVINIVAHIYYKNKKKFQYSEWENAVIYFMEYTIKNLLIPGQIETWDIICDLKNVSITSLPEDLKKLLNILQNNYRCRLYIMYIINIGGWVSLGWSIIRKFLDNSVEKKIKILKNNEINEIFNVINPEQVEKKNGGNAADIDNLFFPPIFPSENYFLPHENKSNILLDEEIYKKWAKQNNKMCLSPHLKWSNNIFEKSMNEVEIINTESRNKLLIHNVSSISSGKGQFESVDDKSFIDISDQRKNTNLNLSEINNTKSRQPVMKKDKNTISYEVEKLNELIEIERNNLQSKRIKGMY